MPKTISAADLPAAKEFRQICKIATDHLADSLKKAADPHGMLNYFTMQIDQLRGEAERHMLARDEGLKESIRGDHFYFRVTKKTATAASASLNAMMNHIEEITTSKLPAEKKQSRYIAWDRLRRLLAKSESLLPEEMRRFPERPVPKQFAGLSLEMPQA